MAGFSAGLGLFLCLLTPTRFSAYLTEYICFSKRHQTLAEDITLRPATLADAASYGRHL